MTSAENSISEPLNLKIFSWMIPPEGSCLRIRKNAPRYKKPSYGPGYLSK